jgi:hypothetical protein
VSAACSAAPGRAGTGDWVDAHKAAITNYYPPFLPAGQLVAILFDHAGRPIHGNVLLAGGSKPPGDSIRIRAREGPDGVFRLDSIVARDYIVQFRALGYETQWHSYRGVPGVVDTVCVAMRAWPIILEQMVPLRR